MSMMAQDGARWYKSTSAETCGTRYNRLCLCVELGLRRLQRGVLWALNMRTIRP